MFFIYVIALVIALYSYGREQAAIKLHHTRAEQKLKEPAAVGAGTSSGDAPLAVADPPMEEETAAGAEGPDASGGTPAAPANSEKARKHAAQARKWFGATQTLVWLGLIFHLGAIVTRGMSAGRFPLGNLYEYMLMITFVAMLITAVIVQVKRTNAVWPWVLTPILLLSFYGATKLYSSSAPVVPALQSFWLPIHVTVVSVGASIGLVSGVFSLLYLLRLWQPAGQEHGPLSGLLRPLPKADVLDRVAYRLAVATVPVLGLGIIFGAIWAETAWGRPWGWDPKETFSFITWVLYCAYLHARATVGWRVVAAWINILALAAMIFNLFFINLVVSGLHSYAGLN